MRPLRPRVVAGAAGLLLLGASSMALAEPGPRLPKGGPVAVDRSDYVAYVADADNAAIHRVDLISLDVTTTPVACAPEQVVVLGGGKVAVSLRDCNRVDVYGFDAAGQGAQLASAEVAPEPWGLAVTPSGDVVVASAWGHTLTALDGGDLSPRFTLDLAREPRSVTVTPDGRRAFVTHAVGDTVTIVDLAAAWDGQPPGAKRLRVLGGQYRNRVDRSIGAGTLHPGASLAFAATLNEEGTRLFVPHLTEQNGGESVHTIPTTYGGVDILEDTTTPSVAVLGARDGRLLGADPPSKKAPARQAMTAAPVRINGDDFADLAVSPAGSPARQVRAAAVLGDALLVTSYGTGELAELDARSVDPAMSLRRVFQVGEGPSGVDVLPEARIAVVWSQFSHEIAVVALGSGDVERATIASDPLPPEVAAGRRIFHTERDHRISRDGRACAGCHPEGRDDGLVWRLGVGPRQTPMLVGRLDEGPFGWLGKNPTLEANVTETMTRLGGTGLPKDRLAELVAFLRRGLRAPPRPAPAAADAPIVARGRELFTSEKVGCSGCHDLARAGSDRAPHDVASKTSTDVAASFRTPPLVFVAGTAPYFHDGRYATLEALLDDDLDRMGQTSHLSAADRAALLAFVRTL
jgi:DNA-binding beta-propeller fold protein YncE